VSLAPGSNAGPYRIVEPLGRGGMASVYRAYEPKLDRYVALKVLPREFLHDPSFAQRFREEARLVAKLEHPNIIPIYAYDIDEAQGIPWMAMRLVPAGSLSDLIKRERLPLARSVALLRGVAEGLDYAHRKGVVHRDIKPQNVLLDDASRVYLADFGIGKMLEGSSAGLTGTGNILGTPHYMAPEQAVTSKVGPSADIYALGIVAYQLFTGRVPFAADTPLAVMMKHVQEPLPLPGPDVVPEPMLRALLKATSKKPEDRWPSAVAFVEALAEGLGGATVPAASMTATMPSPFAAVAPPTVVSPPTRPAASGTAPPLPPRQPPMRPPARETEATRRPVRRTGTLMLALGGLGLVSVVAAAATFAWLWLGGASTPADTTVAQVTPSEAPSAPPTSVPARPAGGAALPAEQPPAPTRATTTPAPAAARTSPVTTVATAPAAAARTAPATPLPTPPPAPVVAAAPPTPAPTPAAPAVDPEVERLAAALGDRDSAARRRAAQELATRGAGAAPATQALVTALSDRSPDVRLRAAEALGRIGPPAGASAEALAAALRDTDALVPAEAAKALGLLGEAAAPAAGALGTALGHRDVGVRREAARSLAKLGRRAEPALAALVNALSDKDKTVCSQSARALGRIGAPARSAVPKLTSLSRDQDVLIAREAQGALESIGQNP
jgi:serine/threonine-protein kinase